MDSSQPAPLGSGGMWTNDTSIKFSCYSSSTSVMRCPCSQYRVYHITQQNSTVPKQVQLLSGLYTKVANSVDDYGIMAPLYREESRNLFLFSYHPEGKVWQISSKLTTTTRLPGRGSRSSVRKETFMLSVLI